MNKEQNLKVSIKSDGNAGNLEVANKKCQDNVLDFRTCEGVLSGNSDFGLFKIELKPEEWQCSGKSLAYSWNYEPGIKVDFGCEIGIDSLDLTYSITNNTDNVLERVQIHPCIPTMGAPSFCPAEDIYEDGEKPEYFDRRGPAMCPCKATYYTLYERLFLWSDEKMFSFKDLETGNSEVHLSLMTSDEPEVEWAWWNNDKETFTLPLIVLSSIDGKFSIGLGFEKSIWASSNVGDERACFHLFPYFGHIALGKTSTVKGKFYFIEGSPEEVCTRFRSDFSF